MRALFTLLALLVACADEPIIDPPTLPTTLHLPEDATPMFEELWLEAASAWADAGAGEMFNRVERGGFGCGVYAELASRIPKTEFGGGNATFFADCKARVLLLSTLPAARRLPVATHELGHVLTGRGQHNPDKRSVLHSPAGSEILPEDVACTRPAVDAGACAY